MDKKRILKVCESWVLGRSKRGYFALCWTLDISKSKELPMSQKYSKKIVLVSSRP